MIRFERHPEDPPLLSTPSGLRDEMARSALWHDIKNFLTERIKDHRKVLESSTDLHEIIRSQAIIANCMDILELPGNLFMPELEPTNGENNGGNR